MSTLTAGLAGLAMLGISLAVWNLHPTYQTGVTFGRLRIYAQPRDWWIGVYIADDAVYVCPIPTMCWRWQRHA